MASRGYMGPNEVQALIGQWVDRRDSGGNPRGQNPPSWWKGTRQQWEKLPSWVRQKRVVAPQCPQPSQSGYPGGQQWPPQLPEPSPSGYPGGQQWPPQLPEPSPSGYPGGQQWPPPLPRVQSPVAGWYDLSSFGVGALPPGALGAYSFPPRAAVVNAPLPTQANRDILPMSTGVPILPTQSAQITGRPQTLVFKIGRFVISHGGTSGGAADWIVNDIKIGNRSQFVQSGDVPGDIFANNAIDTFVRFDTAQTAMDVVVVVTYIGLNESGCPFFGAMVGTAAV